MTIQLEEQAREEIFKPRVGGGAARRDDLDRLNRWLRRGRVVPTPCAGGGAVAGITVLFLLLFPLLAALICGPLVLGAVFAGIITP